MFAKKGSRRRTGFILEEEVSNPRGKQECSQAEDSSCNENAYGVGRGFVSEKKKQSWTTSEVKDACPFDPRYQMDLRNYLEKREKPELDSSGGKFESHPILSPHKQTDSKSRLHETCSKAAERLATLEKVERLTRRIKEEAREKANWTVGMIEVDVGIDRKIQNIEATEKEKKARLIRDFVNSRIKSRGVSPTLQKGSANLGQNESAPITDWLWRPKDLRLSQQEREERELMALMKAFNREGKAYCSRRLLEASCLKDCERGSEDSK